LDGEVFSACNNQDRQFAVGGVIGHEIAKDDKKQYEANRRRTNMTLFNRFATLSLAILLSFLLGCAGTSTTEGTGEYIDDTVITTKVKAAIFDEPTLKSAEINVETFKGTVQLSGFVNSQADINKAVTVARGVGGVEAVRNDMRLK
jgi:BON domain